MTTYDEQVKRFVEVYGPLADSFARTIGGTDTKGMPEPFFPVFGRGYASADPKIAFVGMETRGWGDMHAFLADAQVSLQDAVLREQGEFDEFAFVNWSNNFGMDFWSFVMKFLAKFHGVPDWRVLKRGERDDILGSFAWANMNTIERYEVSAKERGVTLETWGTIKKASLHIDRGEHVIRSLTPDVVVICHWDCDERWLTDGLAVSERVEIGDHLLYLHVQTTNTHVIWTAHPTWLKFNDFDGYVSKCVDLAKEKLGRQS